MSSVIYQSEKAMVIEIGGKLIYNGLLRGHLHTYPIHVNGSCVSCEGPYVLPDIDEALLAIQMLNLKKETK